MNRHFCRHDEILEIFEEASSHRSEMDVRLALPLRYFFKLEPENLDDVFTTPTVSQDALFDVSLQLDKK